MNMALDEAVSEAVMAGESPPTIRFYTWEPCAVSIGYFQCMREEVDVEACSRLGVDYLRRRTGGGAVYHDSEGEITYSVIAPVGVFSDDISESYRQICGRIVEALGLLGIEAEFSPVNDVLVGDRKISGSAQTRRGGVLLQHGTVLYDLNVDVMFSVLRVRGEKISDKMIQCVEERVTCVREQGGVARGELHSALLKSFCNGFDVEFGGFSEKEKARAKELVMTRYRTEEWNFMR
jgi:lipoate-protein ligase A